MKPLLDVAPIRAIQQKYLDTLHRLFGHLYGEMKKHELSPAQIASDVASRPSIVNAIAMEAEEIVGTFEDFWRTYSATVEAYLQNSQAMKSYFGGDISPTLEKEELSAVLLYTDTLVVQCPILRLKTLIGLTPYKELTRLLVKHALGVMRFGELATAEVEPPMLLFPLIAGLPIESLIGLRKEGALEDLRCLLRQAVHNLNEASALDLKRVSLALSEELGSAFSDHERKLDELRRSKRRFFGVDVSSSIITGALSIVGAATGHIPMAVAGAVATAIVGSKPLPAVGDNWRELREKAKSIKRSPAAILLREVR